MAFKCCIPKMVYRIAIVWTSWAVVVGATWFRTKHKRWLSCKWNNVAHAVALSAIFWMLQNTMGGCFILPNVPSQLKHLLWSDVSSNEHAIHHTRYSNEWDMCCNLLSAKQSCKAMNNRTVQKKVYNIVSVASVGFWVSSLAFEIFLDKGST